MIDLNQNATLNDLIIATAISMTDADVLRNQTEGHKAIIRNMVFVRGCLGDRSVFKRMNDAVRLDGIITKIEFEESSSRYVIEFMADNSTDGEVETIRSDRTDSRFYGEFVEYLWSQDLVGKHVRIFKTNETTNMPKIPSVRVAPYVYVLNY